MDKKPKSKAESTLQRACSVARVLERIGDGWSFLVLRATFFGETRFEGFMKALMAPRSQVAKVLRQLQIAGLMERVNEAPGGPRYRLTPCGLDFYPICVGLLDWGDRYARPQLQAGQTAPPWRLRWRDAPAAAPDIVAVWVCAACGVPIAARDVKWQDGPGAGLQPRPLGRRRSPDSNLYARAQPCSVASTLEIVGDVWSFLILREAFFGSRFFDDLVSRLGVARNVLAARLERLVKFGILTRSTDSGDARRRSYRLAEPGLALYPVIVALMNWGDRWISGVGHEPLRLLHQPCAQALVARLQDLHTGQKLEANGIAAVRTTA